MRALAIDIGSSSVRASIVDADGRVLGSRQRALVVSTPAPGLVELDAHAIATTALELARSVIEAEGTVDAVGVTNQRATTVVFDALSGEAIGPALSWQDLRTLFDCLTLQGDGWHFAPNQSITKAAWLIRESGLDPARLRATTLEGWVIWHLSEGERLVCDRTNASVTGWLDLDGDHFDEAALSAVGLSLAQLPELVDSCAPIATASALAGRPPITAAIGDQPASVFGQGLIDAGAKITFGTGAMLDMIDPRGAPAALARFASGCFPTILRSRDGRPTWGIEAISLSAGDAVAWLVDLGLLDSVEDSSDLARSAPDDGGVSFVPAFNGIGTPHWDFGARSGFFGLSRGTSRAQLVRAVLTGVAQRGADLVEAAERETSSRLAMLRVDGGMSANDFFVQELSDLTGRVVEIGDEREATSRGAGLLALVGLGALDETDVARQWRAARRYEPLIDEITRGLRRERWGRDVERVRRTIPEFSEISF